VGTRKRKTIEGYGSVDLTRFSGYMAKLPSNNKVGKASLGLENTEKYKTVDNISDVKGHMEIQNIRTWMTDTARNYLLGDDFPQDLFDDLITNAINDSEL